MSASHRNPAVDNTAARYVAKAMCRVHPQQREELLRAVLAHAQAGLNTILTGRATDVSDDAEPAFLADVRAMFGQDVVVEARV